MPINIGSAFIGVLHIGSTEQDVQALIAAWLEQYSYEQTPAVMAYRSVEALDYINPVWPDRTATSGSNWPGGIGDVYLTTTAGMSYQVIFRAQGDVAGYWEVWYDDTGITFYGQSFVWEKSDAEFPTFNYPENGSDILQELFHGGDAFSFLLGPVNGKGHYQRFVCAPFDTGQTAKVIAMRPTWTLANGDPDPDAEPYDYFTPSTGTEPFEDVRDLTDVDGVAVGFQPDGHVQLRIPYSELQFDKDDIEAAEAGSIKIDAQIIDGDGSKTLPAASYYSYSTGPTATATVDITTESRLVPVSWGTAQVYPAGLPDPAVVTQPRPNLDDQSVELGPGEEFSLVVPEGGKYVTLNIEQDTGNVAGVPQGYVVRELVRSKWYDEGTHTVYWNGRDRTGNPVKPGTYRYRQAMFDSCHTEFFGSAGNSGKPPWRTDDGLGSIGGTHVGPWGLTALSLGVFIFGGGEEGAASIRLIDPDTYETLWTRSAGVLAGSMAATVDGSTIYYTGVSYGFGSQAMGAVNGATGATLWAVDIGAFYEDVPSQYTTGMGAAVIGNYLYLSNIEKDFLKVIDLTAHTTADLAISPAVSGICAFDSTHLLACTGTKIVKIAIADGSQTDFITGLGNPQTVLRDGSNIFVSDCHYTKNQIYRYNTSGVLQQTYGVLGGQTLGLDLINPPGQSYDPLKFGNVLSLGVDTNGDLWACSRAVAPRRYFKLDVTTGDHLDDYFGPWCFQTIGFDENDPTKIYCGIGTLDTVFGEVTMNYAADPMTEATFTLNEMICLTQNGIDTTASPDRIFPDVYDKPVYRRLQVFTYSGADANAVGKRYMFVQGLTRCALYVRDTALNRWRACATIPCNGYYTGSGQFTTSNQTAWYDADGDGLVDGGELVDSVWPCGLFKTINHDLSLNGDVGLLEPSSINANGTPIYTSGTFTPYVDLDELTPYFGNGTLYTIGITNAGGAGGVWGRIASGHEPKVSFHDDSTLNHLKYFLGGEIKFAVSNKDSYFRNDGDVTSSIVGIAGEVTVAGQRVLIWSDWNSLFGAYTTTGVCLGWIVKPDALTGGNAIYVENYLSGSAMNKPTTGEALLLCSTTEDVRVLEVKLEGYTETTGTFTLTETLPRSAVVPSNCYIDYKSWAYLSSVVTVTSIGLDQYDRIWNEQIAPILIKDDDGKTIAEIRLRRDAGQLCVLAYGVCSEVFPGTEQDALDQFGKVSGVELMLGTMDNPTRTSAQQGDTRVFFTTQGATRPFGRFDGVAVMCRPASTDLTGNSHMRYCSDWYTLEGEGYQGEFFGTAPTGALDYSTPDTMPNSRVVGMQREGNMGWMIAAELPLAYFPELVALTTVGIQRPGNSFSEERYDMTGALIKFNAAVWIQDGTDNPVRHAWKDDGFTGTDIAVMNPSLWGTANGPIEYMLDEDGDGVGVS